MEIVSRDNETFKHLLRLIKKKYRRQFSQCIIEGEKVVNEHLTRATQVFTRKSKGCCVSCGVPDIVHNIKYYVLDDKLFDLVSSLENDQGVLAIVSIPAPTAPTTPYLVLDTTGDTGNMGTLLRTAAAFGFNTIYCINCADPYSQKTLRAAAATQFALNIIETTHTEFAAHFNTYLAHTTLYLAEAGGKTPQTDNSFGLVLGNEGQGINPTLKTLSHKIASIPMQPTCESLNVAIAGAILMYELTKH